LISGLRCSSNCDIINLREGQLRVTFYQSTHSADEKIVCARIGEGASGFAEGGTDCIDENNGA
jgi:hypothetical protein